MGAGASASTAEKIAQASPEDLKAALSNLPADQIGKIEAALGQGKSEAKAEAKSEAKAADPKPATDAPPPDSGYAPHLKEAFNLLATRLKKLFEANTDDLDDDKIAAEMEASAGEFQQLLGKSFDHHDTNGSGVLEPAEAKVFFKNLLLANSQLSDSIIECVVMQTVQAELQRLLKELPSEEDRKEARAEAKDGIRVAMMEHKKGTAKKIMEFKKNAAQRCEDAFEIIDKNEDETLQRAEFLEAMRPNSEKYDALIAALGMD